VRPVRQTEIPGVLDQAFASAIEELLETRAIRRLAGRDASLWGSESGRAAVVANRLGWLDAPEWLEPRLGELRSFAAGIRDDGFTRVLLLGMGGSSLAPEVLQNVCTPGPGAPTLDVLDSTDPDRDRAHRGSEPPGPDVLPRLEQVRRDDRDTLPARVLPRAAPELRRRGAGDRASRR
jgi:hypothetical protein